MTKFARNSRQGANTTPSKITGGYLGDGDYRPRDGGLVKQAHSTWGGMLRRCSDPNNKCYYLYKHCSVCAEWLNFQNFAKWYLANYVEGYHIDKDIIVEGNSIYGPDTCKFVSPQANTEKARSKHYTLMSPEGVKTSVYNMRKFARDHNLDNTCIHNVATGKAGKHKGWTLFQWTS